MLNIWKLFRNPVRREKQLIKDCQGFMKKHKDYLVFITDPETDLMVGGFGGYITTARICDKQGKPIGVVKKLLHARHKKFKRYIDQFLLFIDGFLANLSEKLHELKKVEQLKDNKP